MNSLDKLRAERLALTVDEKEEPEDPIEDLNIALSELITSLENSINEELFDPYNWIAPIARVELEREDEVFYIRVNGKRLFGNCPEIDYGRLYSGDLYGLNLLQPDLSYPTPEYLEGAYLEEVNEE